MPPDFGHTVLTINKTPTSYSAIISPVPNCNGGSACTYASIEGNEGMRVDKRGRKPTRLKDGTIAWFESHRCGANCNGSATLVFGRNGTLYTVAVKSGTLPMAVTIANGLRKAR